MDRELLWLWLSLLFGPNKAIYRKIYTDFDIQQVYDFDDYDVDNNESFSDYEKRNLLDKNLEEAYKVRKWCEINDVKIITLESDNYPKRLLDLEKFPGVLYCKGELPNIDESLAISIVGTRKHTNYGAKTAFNLGYGLTKGGALVISGGALGIDIDAQRGALMAGGKTVVVLGSGIDIYYPKENKDVFDKIVKDGQGAIITEYKPKTPPDGYNFPVRNRIIAALSLGTVVVEGGTRSGAGITAENAKSLGRNLFAVPGPAGEVTSYVPNELIKKKEATLVTEAIDVLEEYLDKYSEQINLSASKEKLDVFDDSVQNKETSEKNFIERLFSFFGIKSKSKTNKPQKESSLEVKNEELKSKDTSMLSPEAKLIYDYIEPGVEYDADMLDELDMNPGDISASILYLIINGFVKETPGGRFIKI